jgi:DnaJ-domain-containing protein 1
MGHLTKSKGRVTEADIQIASVFMDRMNLHGDSAWRRKMRFASGNPITTRFAKKCASSAASASAF